MRSPVLFLVFNRPETTKRVFESIRSARPPRLYIAADGPRRTRPKEAEKCAEVRMIVASVDWPCEVRTLYQDENLGCKRGVVTGINWFFENEEEGVILEDDVLPCQSFFSYCDELLERYRFDQRIGVVSGCNLIASKFVTPNSYFFSRYNHVWGWASWRRAWKFYDSDMKEWPKIREQGLLKKISCGSKCFELYWRKIFDDVYAGKIDTWDYQWTFACWRYGILAVLPKYNQTENIGFGRGATHTNFETPRYIRESAPLQLNFPLQHPVSIELCFTADKVIDKYVFQITVLKEMRQKIRNIYFIGPMFVRIWRAINKIMAN